MIEQKSRSEVEFDKLVGLIEQCSVGDDPTDDSVRPCVANRIKEVDECVRLVLISDGSCGPCAETKAALEKEGTPFETLDATSSLALSLLEKMGYDTVPQLVVLGCDNDVLVEMESPGG